jgi:hypothetical protein
MDTIGHLREIDYDVKKIIPIGYSDNEVNTKPLPGEGPK